MTAKLSPVSIVCLCWLVSGATVSASPQQTLLTNGSFTQGLTGWSPHGLGAEEGPPVEVDRAWFRGGDMAAMVMRTDTGKRGLMLQAGVPRVPDADRYRFTVWVSCRGVGPDWIIRVGIVAASGTVVGRTLQNAHIAHERDMDWVQVALETTLPPEVTHLGVYMGLWYSDALLADPPAGAGRVWFDDATLTALPAAGVQPPPGPALAPGLRIDGLWPAGEAGLFLAGQPVELTLLGSNDGDAAAELEMSISVRDYEGRPVAAKQVTLALPPGGPFQEGLRLPPIERLGFFRVETAVRAGEATGLGPQTSFCIVRAPERGDSYFVADVNGRETELVRAMRLIGVSGRKIGATLRMVPAELRADPERYWRESVTTGGLAAYWDSDLELIGNVFLGHSFMPADYEPAIEARRELGLFPYPDEAFAEFGDFVAAAARVLCPRVRMWVLSEEIDGTVGLADLASGSQTAELMRYVMMSRIAWQRLKQVDPQCTVIGLAVSSDFNRTPRYQLVQRLLPDLRDYIDVIGPDLYTDPWDWTREVSRGPEAGEMRSKLLDTIALQRSIGKAPVTSISERGYGIPHHLTPDDPLERLQAELTARSLIIGKSVPEVMFYALHVMCGGTAWRVHGGAVSTDESPLVDLSLWRAWLEPSGKARYRPRAAVAAYRTVAEMLGGSEACIEVLPQTGVYAYVFTCPQDTVAAVWTTDPEPCPIRLELPAAARCADLMGNARDLAAGAADLSLSGSPLFLRASVAPDDLAAALRQALFPDRMPVRAEAHLSDLSTLSVHLCNRLDRALPVEVELTRLEGATATNPRAAATVPALGSARVDLPLEAVAADGPGTVELSLSAGGVAWPLHAELSVHRVPAAPATVRVDGELGEWDRPALIALDEPAQLMPGREVIRRGAWTGPADLSVQAWLGWDAQHLYLAARVRDDVHLQRQQGELIWMDDCVQFAFDAANDALRPETCGHRGYDANDLNAGIALTDGGAQCYVWVEHGATGMRGPRDFPLAVRRTGDETCYEVAIPWSALSPLAAEPGRAFGFSLIAFDTDREEDRQADYWLGLSGGIANGQDPSHYPTFALVP
ncbi:MAG: sugar-binding protein [Armatimonadota bacterium]